MKHDQKCRALKMVRASLNNALSSNAPSPSGEVTLTESQINSALTCVNSVLNDKDAEGAALSPVDIAQLVLEVLQLILSHLPGGTTNAPAPKSLAPAIDVGSILTIAETIMQILELVLSKLPQKGTATPAPAPAPSAEKALSGVDIASLVLAVLQLLLSKFGTPAPTPAPTPSA